MRQRLLELLREENAGLRAEGVMMLAMGTGVSLFATFLVFIVSWFISWALLGAANATLGASGLSLGYLVVATCVAWRVIEPLAPFYGELAPLASDEGAALQGTSAATLRAQRRQSLAGIAWAPIAGPASLLDGVSRLRSRYPTEGHVVTEVAGVLEEMGRGQTLVSAVSPPARAMLDALRLTRHAEGLDGEHLLLLSARGQKLFPRRGAP